MFKKGKKVTQKSKHEFGPVSRKEVAEAGGSLEEVYRRRAAAGDEGAKATIVRIEMKKHVNDVDEDDKKDQKTYYQAGTEAKGAVEKNVQTKKDVMKELYGD